ncbi:hypothetical protein M5361_13525 [Ligilactobacillus agilis]|nr:hypothetical protein [Ligilactobacillus agilis]
MKCETPSLLELILKQNTEWARYIQVLNTYDERIFSKSKANSKDAKLASKLIQPADGKLQPYFLLKALIKQAVIDACNMINCQLPLANVDEWICNEKDGFVVKLPEVWKHTQDLITLKQLIEIQGVVKVTTQAHAQKLAEEKFNFLSGFFTGYLPNYGPLHYEINDWQKIIQSTPNLESLIDYLAQERPYLKEIKWSDDEENFIWLYSALSKLPIRKSKVQIGYLKNNHEMTLECDVDSLFHRVHEDSFFNPTTYVGIDCSAIVEEDERKKFEEIFGDKIEYRYIQSVIF